MQTDRDTHMEFLEPKHHELAVIGILAGGIAQDLAPAYQLTPDDFSDADAKRIFTACLQLHQQHKPLSFPSLDEQLTKTHGQDQGSGLMQTAMSAAREHRLNSWQLPEEVQIVQDRSTRRKLMRNGMAIARGAADEQRDVTELIAVARNNLHSITPAGLNVVTMQDALISAYEALERAEKPIPTGIVELDLILQGGLHKGELTVLGARPAVGKSAVLLQAALSAAESGRHVVYVSLEMSAAQLGARMLGRYGNVNIGRLRGGTSLTDDQWLLLANGMNEAENAISNRMSFMPTGGLTVEELSLEVNRQRDKGMCDLLVVDYLQLLRTKQRTTADVERLGIISRSLKAITLDTGIPVLTAAQVRRQSNGGILRAPGLDELRGSGDIEQDADNVILLHRPESEDDPTLTAYSRQSGSRNLWEQAQRQNKKLMHINVAKQRQGATSWAWSIFDSSRMIFEQP